MSLIVLSLESCSHTNPNKHIDGFYNTISEEFDLICVPIVKPYRAVSVDHGRSWLLVFDFGSNAVKIKSFGVSKNFIYGYGNEVLIDGQQDKGWFAFDMNFKLLAVYPTQQELTDNLKSFDIQINTIASCEMYFDSLAKSSTVYWFPKKDANYPVYPGIKPYDINEITITESSNGKVDFNFKPAANAHKNLVYFFKVNYNKKQNDLYYLSIGNHQSTLVKDGLLLPVFIDNKQFDVTLYTPVPVAEEKKIDNNKRYKKSKVMYLK